MEERQVSSDGVTRMLPIPFFVIATQNNIEMTGTYPLPEAQVDRFFARVALGYPERSSETEILRTQQAAAPIDFVKQVTELDELIRAQEAITQIFVHDVIRDYIVDVVRSTRESSLLTLGSSPRGSLYLMHAAQARAAFEGSDYVRPDDVKAMAPLILGHRLIVRGEVRARGTSGPDIVRQLLEAVPTPVPVG